MWKKLLNLWPPNYARLMNESELSGPGSFTLHGAYGGLSQKLIFLNWRQGLKFWGPSTREYRPSRFIMPDKAAYPIGWLLQGNFP